MVCNKAAANPESLEIIPKFKKDVNRLGEIVDEVDVIAIQQETDLKGIAVEKDKTIDDMIDLDVDISGAIHSYAKGINDMVLLDKVNFPASSWEKMSDAKLLNNTGIIVSLMKNIPAEAYTEVGIIPEDLQQLEELYDKFKEVQPAPREAIIDRKGYTARLGELFDEAHDIVKNSLDKLASQYKRKDPEFYQIYKSARQIIDLGGKQSAEEEDAA
jgi:hypothetical protein